MTLKKELSNPVVQALIFIVSLTLLALVIQEARGEPYTQELCILVLSDMSYDCSWTLFAWEEGQYSEFIEARAETHPNPEEIYEKYCEDCDYDLSGFYNPNFNAKQVHIYLPMQHQGDIYGWKTTAGHEIYGHAFQWVNWFDRLDPFSDVNDCPCNFHP